MFFDNRKVDLDERYIKYVPEIKTYQVKKF